jgi:hypothetical protein
MRPYRLNIGVRRLTCRSKAEAGRDWWQEEPEPTDGSDVAEPGRRSIASVQCATPGSANFSIFGFLDLDHARGFSPF